MSLIFRFIFRYRLLRLSRTRSGWVLLALPVLLAGCVTTKAPEQQAARETLSAESGQALVSSRLVVVAVGDIMLGGTAEPELQKFGYDYPFVNVKNILSEADIVFGNLEGPLTNKGSPEVEKKYKFRSPPGKVAPALARAGFDVVSLANNHTLDYGTAGLEDTLNALADAGIKYAGAGNNLAAAREAAILLRNNTRVAILAYSLTFPEDFWATTDKPGTAFGHAENIKEDVASARQQADIVIVSFHWGREGTTVLRDYQAALGRAAIDAGASAVLGHHPHILQGIEKYKQGLIFYSFGNFVFGSYSRTAQRSVIARLVFEKHKLQSVKLIPINVNNVELIFQPQILQGQQARAVIESLRQLSETGGVNLKYSDGVGTIMLDNNQ
ncbi:MAG: CapA family protein [Gammaproteobacteria bacterium]|nr:MAG: CapA family protein [Gammaproteobacteria bacterium]